MLPTIDRAARIRLHMVHCQQWAAHNNIILYIYICLQCFFFLFLFYFLWRDGYNVLHMKKQFKYLN